MLQVDKGECKQRGFGSSEPLHFTVINYGKELGGGGADDRGGDFVPSVTLTKLV